jgi:3-oxoacyl-[acyl-carrier protein] reductase
VARTATELEETITKVRAAGRRAIALPLDVSADGADAHIARTVRAELGRVDILINNAAVVEPLGSITTITAHDWAQLIDINLVAPLRLTRVFIDGMLERRWGRIVNVSSSVAVRPEAMIRGNAYVTSKAGLEAHTLNLAAELAETGVTVNVVRPGTVDTAMQTWIREQSTERVGTVLHDRFAVMYSKGSLTNPAEPAAVIVDVVQGGTTGTIVDVRTRA